MEWARGGGAEEGGLLERLGGVRGFRWVHIDSKGVWEGRYATEHCREREGGPCVLSRRYAGHE